MSARRYLSTSEVAARYGIVPPTLYEWVAAGLVPFRKLPHRKRLFFLESDLDLFDDGATRLEKRKTPGGGIVCRPVAIETGKTRR